MDTQQDPSEVANKEKGKGSREEKAEEEDHDEHHHH